MQLFFFLLWLNIRLVLCAKASHADPCALLAVVQVLRELVLAKLATHLGGEGLAQALLDQVMDTWEVRVPGEGEPASCWSPAQVRWTTFESW